LRIRQGAEDGKGLIGDGDSVICFNFRADEMREITSTFVSKEFGGFLLPSRRPRLHYVCLTEYDAGFMCRVVYP
jgi:2,3-bisphosphoglycerate-independent phosphoglycerate mutase